MKLTDEMVLEIERVLKSPPFKLCTICNEPMGLLNITLESLSMQYMCPACGNIREYRITLDE